MTPPNRRSDGADLVSVVIPTLGKSPWLASTLASLRRSAAGSDQASAAGSDNGRPLEIIVVDQGPAPLAESIVADADRVVRLTENQGFSGGTNAGIEVASGEWIATVNDDVVVAPQWLPALLDAVARKPEVVAVQGVNLSWRPDPSAKAEPPSLHAEACIDGAGIAWNRWGQALQSGRGERVSQIEVSQIEGGEFDGAEIDASTRPVFGVSATAALYRRKALDAVRLADSLDIFDTRLQSYYEDVDLACRLRAQGGTSLLVPTAHAWHAESTTGVTRPRRRWRQIYGNRHLVLARALGRDYWRLLPRALARDSRDLLAALVRLEATTALGIVEGWARALRHVPAYAHFSPPRGLELRSLGENR